MKIKKIDGTEIEVAMKGRHAKQIMKCYSDLTANDNDMGKAMDTYNTTLEKIVTDTTGLTVEEIDEMPIEDRNAILNAIQEKALGQLDFLKSSFMSGSSAPKTR